MKRKIIFPEVHTADSDGLVAIGGDLEVDTLQTAYKKGIFPWPVSIEFQMAWFSPNPRGILEFSELHLSRSFEKFLRKNPYHVTFNQDFSGVIRACAHMRRKGQPTTWILPSIIHAYEMLFKENLAYSVEVWNQEHQLVGGIYGVMMGNFVSGESMFTMEDNASKFGLFSLIKKLESAGITWLDTQMVTPVVEQFGGKYVNREKFLELLDEVNWDLERDEILK